MQTIACLVLGLASSGKSSFCRTLTQDPEVIIANGPNGTTKFKIARSTKFECAKKNVKWSLIDTVGMSTENYLEKNLFLDIQNQLINEDAQIEKLDCVIFIQEVGSRGRFEEIKKTLDAVNFIDRKKNLVFVFTKYDQHIDILDDDLKEIKAEELEYLSKLGIPEDKMVYWINEKPNDPKFMNRLRTDYDWKSWFESQEGELIKTIQKCEAIPMKLLNKFWAKLMDLCKSKILPNIFTQNINLERWEKRDYSFFMKIYKNDWGDKLGKDSFWKFCDKERKREKNIRLGEANQQFKDQIKNEFKDPKNELYCQLQNDSNKPPEKNFKSCVFSYINSHFLEYQNIDMEKLGQNKLILKLNEKFLELMKGEMGITCTFFKKIEQKNEFFDVQFIEEKNIFEITKIKEFNEPFLNYEFGISFKNVPKIEPIVEILLKDYKEEKSKLWQETFEEFNNGKGELNELSHYQRGEIAMRESNSQSFKKQNKDSCVTKASELNSGDDATSFEEFKMDNFRPEKHTVKISNEY